MYLRLAHCPTLGQFVPGILIRGLCLALELLQKAFQMVCDQAGANAQLFSCQRYIHFHTYIGGLVVQVVHNTQHQEGEDTDAVGRS